MNVPATLSLSTADDYLYADKCLFPSLNCRFWFVCLWCVSLSTYVGLQFIIGSDS